MILQKKIAAFLLFIALIAPAAPVAVPRAQAGFPVSITVNFDMLQSVLDGIGWGIAKAMIRSITQSVVMWINSGFEGSPLFVTNMRAHLLGLADAKVQELLDQIEIRGSIESPYLDSIGRVLQEGYLRATAAQAYFQQNRYTLDQYCTNPDAFRRGDFSQGGFRCWNAAWRSSGNNPFLSVYSAEQELQRRIRVALQDRSTELNWGRGFISWRGNCESSEASAEGEEASLSSAEQTSNCPVRTPGGVIEEQLVHVLGSDVRQLEIADSINEIVAALAGQVVNSIFSEIGLTGLAEPSSEGGRPRIEEYGNSTEDSNGQAFEVTLRTAEVQTGLFKEAWTTIQTAAQGAKNACEDNGGYVLLQGSNIDPTLQRAGNEITRADRALAELQSLRTRFTQAQQTSNSEEKRTLSEGIVRAYERLLQQGVLISEQDFRYAITESQSVSQDDPQTLYDKMKKHEEACS